MIWRILWISAGAVLGVNGRYLVAGWAADRFGSSLPYGTLIVNLTGSFLLGMFIAATTERFLLDPDVRAFVAIGFLGAFTTFSTFSFESIRLITDGSVLFGLLNLFGSPLVGALLAYAGYLLGRLI